MMCVLVCVPMCVPVLVLLCLASSECAAVPKPHVITFGRWISAKWPNATGQGLLDLKVRPLFVDTRLKEYTVGLPHELTDRLFVVRRAFRVNDALPPENTDASANSPRWQGQRGGWLLVDRLTGHVSQLNLPEFDPFHSTASWYRDHIAYCGVSEDGKKLYALVAQVGRRKPILKKEAGEPAGGARSRLGVSASNLGKRAHASDVSAWGRAEAGVHNTKPRGRRGQRRRRTGRMGFAC